MNPSLREDALGLPASLRSRIRPLLPERAFLKRDRGDGLFITNAPLFADGASLAGQLRCTGFACEISGSRLIITPGPQLLTDFELRHGAPDFLCESLLRMRGAAPCPEAVLLFSRGISLMENDDPGRLGEYLKNTRRLAALCLRTHRGGAYGCALIAHILQTERSHTI